MENEIRFEVAKWWDDKLSEEERKIIIPEYATRGSAGADFKCAEKVTIEPYSRSNFKPTLVHTGIKAKFDDSLVLELYNRSSNTKRGLVMANSVGIIDSDYYGNESNDGEIMFAFYNISDKPIEISIGERIGQGLFKNVYKAVNAVVASKDRKGGFGSTGLKG